MKRPQKKKPFGMVGTTHFNGTLGYNQALDDMEAYLPKELEIWELICQQPFVYEKERDLMQVAKAISKRIRE